VSEQPLRYFKAEATDGRLTLRDAYRYTRDQVDRHGIPKKDYVFLGRTGEAIDPDVVDRAFKRHLTLAKQLEIRFHDLRHTFASYEIAAGVHPKTLQAELGHASITVTMDRYGHLMPTALEEATALRRGVHSRHQEGTNGGGTETRTARSRTVIASGRSAAW